MKNIKYYTITLLLLFIVVIGCQQDELLQKKDLPIASFTLNPVAPKMGFPVKFMDTSTDEDGEIISWLWNFEDGGVSQEQNPTHTFNHATIYKVRLTVKNKEGGEDTKEVAITVLDPSVANLKPIASFTTAESIVKKGAEVAFIDTSTDPDGTVTSWLWNFGDGSTATTKNATHFFSGVGTFKVTLTVKDNLGGDSVVFSKELKVWGQKWAFATGDAIKPSSPAIGSDGTIYVGSDDNKLYAINPDGTQKWSFATTGNIQNSPAIGADGTIYVGSDDKNLYAVNPNGTLKWSFNTGGIVNMTSNSIGADGTIYVGSTSDKVFAINPDGTQKWSYTADGDIWNLALSSNILYVNHNGSRKLVSLNANNGSFNWAFTHTSFAGGSMAVDNQNTVYFQGDLGGGAGKIWAINSDGTQKWNYPLAGSASRGGIVLANDGTLYAATKVVSAPLIALNSTTGAFKWNYTSMGTLSATPLVDKDGNIYIGSDDKTFYVLDSSGKLKYTFPTGGNIWSSATMDVNGTVYFGSYDFNLYAIEFLSNGLDTGVWPKLGKNIKNTTNK